MEKKSHLLEKKDTYDINTITGQLVAQLTYRSSSLIADKDLKHLKEIIKLIDSYKKSIKKYKDE